MTDIAIYGAGGLGREVASMLDQMYPEDEPMNLVGFFDDGMPAGRQIGHYGKVLGGMERLNSWERPLAVALCFGDGRITRAVHSRITNPLVSFPNLINRTFFISDPESFKLGRGNIIHGLCVVTTNVEIGDFNLLNGDVTMGHDVHVGSYNTFMPGCRISGEVTIGDGCLFGAMSFVKQQLHIGNGVRISPLSPLLKNPQDNCLYVGNPAKKFKF